MRSLFEFGKAIMRGQRQERAAADLKAEAANMKLPSDAGYLLFLKYCLFVLFGYYNARLFIVIRPGFEGLFTAFFALAGEATALYCINTFPRTVGAHKWSVGIFGALLTAFSVTHATISFFNLDQHAAASHFITLYCEKIAFPLLFSLLLAAAVVIPLTHWRKKALAARAKAITEIEISKAEVLTETAALQAAALTEQARLDYLTQALAIEAEYVDKVEQYAQLKMRESKALEGISDPKIREEIARLLGRSSIQPAEKAQIKELPASGWNIRGNSSH
ncbi:MAG: hypothetical protein BWY07_01994 [Candidatus Hydrogenedentes bacterium ADurb.Bin170]|nr:MAG: hypothetical protein BWY07_01994 [Candidatus Hydrogenedentes bacterium ADurb.Bin170]